MSNDFKDDIGLLIASVESIPAEKRYWLIRTQSGTLYDTFRENHIVALEHMDIPLSSFNNFNKEAGDNETKLRSLIRNAIIEVYETKFQDSEEQINYRQSTLIANQIYKFVYEIKKGDVVIIPSYNSDLISFGEVSESYIGNFTIEELRKIDTDAILKKRVKWVKDIPRRELDPYLYRMFTAHQAVIDVGSYAEVIERSLKDFFILDNEAHLIINIQSEQDISASDLFGLGSDLLYLVDKFAKDYNIDICSKDLQVSISLNSPGKIDLKSKIKKVTLISGLILAVFGGGYKNKYIGDLTTDGLPGLIKAISDFRDRDEQRSMREKIFNTYKDSLKIKDVDDMNKLIKQFSENKDSSK